MSKKLDNQAKRTKKSNQTSQNVPAPKPKKIKEPGPRPLSYDPNPAKMRAKQLIEARLSYPEFCSGKPGSYLIGLIDGTDNPAFKMEVRTFHGEKEDFLIIEGEVMFYSRRVYIGHDWIFLEPRKCPYARGQLGVIQFEMVTFIQKVMREELHVAKIHQEDASRESSRNEKEPQQMSTEPETRQTESSTIDFSTAARLLAPALIGRMREGDASRLLYLGEGETRSYFMRERIAGAQKLRLIKADDHPEFSAILEAHPQGVDVDVRSVIDGNSPEIEIGNLADLRNARLHLAGWLHAQLPAMGYYPKRTSSTP